MPVEQQKKINDHEKPNLEEQTHVDLPLAQLGCLGAREPEKWNHFDLFRQIILAVQGEYGELLVVTPETKWSNVPSALESEIKEWKQKKFLLRSIHRRWWI